MLTKKLRGSIRANLHGISFTQNGKSIQQHTTTGRPTKKMEHHYNTVKTKKIIQQFKQSYLRTMSTVRTKILNKNNAELELLI